MNTQKVWFITGASNRSISYLRKKLRKLLYSTAILLTDWMLF